MATATGNPTAATTPTPPSPADSGSVFDHRHRITVDEFMGAIDAHVFGPERPRFELLDGMIVERPRKSINAVQSTDLTQYVLIQAVPTGYFLTMSTPITIVESDTMSVPAASVIRGTPRDYENRWRTPADSALTIEVADVTYALDRQAKWTLYAAAGLPTYWIVDLNNRRLEVHDEPVGEGTAARYGRTRVYAEGDEAALVLDGREIARFTVRDLLP